MVVGKKACDERLEGWAQLSAVYSLEVLVKALSANHIVILVLEDLGAMRELTLNDDEQEDAHGEDVNLCSIVNLLFEHFGRDIARRANCSSNSSQVSISTQAQVNQFECQVCIYEDILKLQVPMAYTCLSMHVFESIKHLVQEQSASVLTETLTVRVLNQIEHVKEVASKVLRHQVDVLVVIVFVALDMHDAAKTMAQHVQDIFMV